MNIVITSGGTREPIDKVRSITNKSSGKLGSKIAAKFLSATKDSQIFYICRRDTEKVPCEYYENNRVNYIYVDTAEDVEREVVKILTENKIDIFVHAMAVADYTVDKLIDIEELKKQLINLKTILSEDIINKVINNSTIDNSSKISSNHSPTIVLKKTPKIISLIKEHSPYTFLVGFKLLNDVTDEELFDVGFDLLRKNRCNLVLANDLEEIKSGIHKGLLIVPEKNYSTYYGKDTIANAIVLETLKRVNSLHPVSVNTNKDSEIPTNIFNSMKNVGKILFENGYLPVVPNYNETGVHLGTYGNMSILDEDNQIYITGRNVNKGDLTKKDISVINKVQNVNIQEDLKKIYSYVHYSGIKPSIDTAIHSSIYEITTHKAILHVHTDKVYLNFPLITENYPCGSNLEKDAIIQMIKEHPENKVIQMYKHGLIILGNTLEECYDTLTSLDTELYIDYGSNEWEEGAKEHFIDVTGYELPYFSQNDVHPICYNKDIIGNVYERRDLNPDIPEIKTIHFSIITGEKAKRKGLGIIKKYLALYKNNYEMFLYTKPACEIKDLYVNKYGFRDYMTSPKGFIILKKSPFPRIIGLTGYSGSGKSMIARHLEEMHDFIVLDCDQITHRLYKTDEVKNLIRNEFGDVFTPNGDVDRRKLGAKVFSSHTEREKLNQLIHPLVTEDILKSINIFKTSSIIIDAPLLYEVNEIIDLCDFILVVDADYELKIDRITKRDAITRENAIARLETQTKIEKFKEKADYVIYNNSEDASFEIKDNMCKEIITQLITKKKRS